VKRGIPAVRADMIVLAADMRAAGFSAWADRLDALAMETVRRKPAKPRAPISARVATPDLAEEIRAYAKAHPIASYREIGRAFNVDGGRVSEALHGLT
jgi:hypothetical protein